MYCGNTMWDTVNWHHVGLIYDGSTATVVGDGQIRFAPTVRNWPLVKDKAYIGCQVTGGDFWMGGIDEVRISNVALKRSQFLFAGNACLADFNNDSLAGK